jgi:hypothetical protein
VKVNGCGLTKPLSESITGNTHSLGKITKGTVELLLITVGNKINCGMTISVKRRSL